MPETLENNLMLAGRYADTGVFHNKFDLAGRQHPVSETDIT